MKFVQCLISNSAQRVTADSLFSSAMKPFIALLSEFPHFHNFQGYIWIEDFSVIDCVRCPKKENDKNVYVVESEDSGKRYVEPISEVWMDYIKNTFWYPSPPLAKKSTIVRRAPPDEGKNWTEYQIIKQYGPYGTTQLILKVCDDRGDYEASLVHERIKGVPSLTDVDARYHEDCYRKFLQHPGRGKHGRPADPTLEKVTEFIIHYSGTLLFQASLIKHPQSYSITDAYFKFVSDNADQNKRTIDGYGTLHVLGNIQIVNPASSVTSEELIPRLKQLPSAAELGKAGVWELQKYHSSMKDGSKNVIMKVVGHGKDKSPLDLFNSRDLAWLYDKSHKPLETKGWNAFMAMVCELQEYQTSRVLPLPIVNNPPSDYDTIYTALLYADREARRRNRMHVFCTFDNPLYMISEYIIENQDPKKPRLRCISSIENSLEAILSGKAYDRAMRGHKLVLNGISTLIFRGIEFSSEELSTINVLLTGMDKPDFDVIKVLNCDVMELMTQKFLSACKSLEKRSPTAKLWIQYFSLGILMFKIVEAVKKGDWGLFLNAVEHTLPLFHATAHLNYAKATHLYLQKMLTLEEIMDPIEYDTYTKKQCWVIRRKDVFFSGNPDDLIIEQVFMRTMKTMGGLTHGRGTTDSVFARWIMSMIVLHDITCAVDDSCSEGYAASEQFSDDRKALTKRDAADLEKIVEYLSSHNPFDVNDTESIVSISTALRGDERVNCHRVYEIGNSLLSGTFGKKYEDIKLQRKNRVVSLAAAQSSVTTDDGDVVRIDPTLLFQRLSMIIENKEDMREHLKLELAPYPKALFDQDGMCKTQKHKFIENFTPLSEKPDCSEMKYVIDGGFLLHRVMWSQDELIDDVLKKYVKYVTDHFSQGCTIIFDGYPDVPQARHIKSLERARRLNQNQARECKLR
ncbi:hypothetical protein QAD02_003027 [Eretmocerus hayati]|uniref:Uncharacterized protein n=1 Tax=Eretmocerus hayati TaxID=131215 RepID=A0ACC2NKN9_9HYME|nr:hypothetical protein QAD02_003027 [Eretmocerus hayati]